MKYKVYVDLKNGDYINDTEEKLTDRIEVDFGRVLRLRSENQTICVPIENINFYRVTEVEDV